MYIKLRNKEAPERFTPAYHGAKVVKIIDPHAHLRDIKKSGKAMLADSARRAWAAGIVGIFEMPNTNSPIIDEETLKQRLALADAMIDKPLYHGVYLGLTTNESQIKEAVRLHRAHFPRVVGLKLYAGSQTGLLAVAEEEAQRLIYQVLSEAGYKGVLAVHCEKESLIGISKYCKEAPITRGPARSAMAEADSIADQIIFARECGYQGRLHICHLSSALPLPLIERARKHAPFAISCGVTPQHLLFSEDMLRRSDGLLYKTNPPLRSEDERQLLMQAALEGRINLIESDHAPEKSTGASGIESFDLYPQLIQALRLAGASEELLERLFYKEALKVFNLDEKLFALPH